MKNKAYKLIIPVFLSIFTLSGCSNSENEPGVSATPGFTGTINNGQGRAFNTSWESGDAIGISGCNRSNVCYITTGDGTFSAKDPGTEIYFQDDKETTFNAYYPWNDLTSGTSISFSTEDQTKQNTFDYLWATGSGKKSSPIVNLNFAHKMSKVFFTIYSGKGMTFDDIKGAKFSLAGFSHDGTFDTTNGSTSAGNVSESWTFSDLAKYNENEKTLTFSLIFVPQIFTEPLDFVAKLNLSDGKELSLSAKIDFSSANETADNQDAKNEWVAGRQYNLSLTLNKTDVTLNTCTISPWAIVTGNEISVD